MDLWPGENFVLLYPMSDASSNPWGLNEGQIKAVEAVDGRIRVVAGAGSGKTRVLAARYAFLVEEIGVDPANILCMTFTNKAAQEMKQRIATMLHDTAHVNDLVCTIHGFCVKVLRREIYRLGFPASFTVVDEEDSKVFARQVMDALGIDRRVTTVKQFLAHISSCKSQLGDEGYVPYLLPEKFRPEDATGLDEETFGNAFTLYLHTQLRFLALDFNDLIYMTLYILKNFEDARTYWQNEIDYVQVDEVQDCNVTDWEIIDIVSARSGNLFIVGDPDQAIYEWRGARPSFFVDFSADETIVLDRNYRSTSDILAVANSVISHNRKRIPKNLYTAKAPGAKVLHLHARNESEEAAWIADRIQNLACGGPDAEAYSGMAILYRASHLSRVFEQALIARDIPYVVWGGVKFFERKEIKDMLAYLRLIANPLDDMAFERIINVPSRRFGQRAMEQLKAVAEATGRSLMDTLVDNVDAPPFSRTGARDFTYLIHRYSQISRTPGAFVSAIMEGVLNDSGLKEMIRTDVDEDRLQNINELLASVKNYERTHSDDSPESDELESSPTTLQIYLQDIALYTDSETADGTSMPGVRLMTIHQAKGLEFPYVFVVGLTEGIFPSHRSIRERKHDGLEEERRLMYVAVTRGEKAVVLSESEGYDVNSSQEKYPSRFLSEIDASLIEIEGNIDEQLRRGTTRLVQRLENEITAMELGLNDESGLFAPGTVVLHSRFGRGTVIENNPERGSARVQFDNDGRTVNLRYGVLISISN